MSFLMEDANKKSVFLVVGPLRMGWGKTSLTTMFKIKLPEPHETQEK